MKNVKQCQIDNKIVETLEKTGKKSEKILRKCQKSVEKVNKKWYNKRV